MASGELEFVEWLRGQQQRRRAVALGIGDDMAAVSVGAGLVLVSCDMLLDGVHFDTSRQGLSQIGRKAVACGLSDCAAMAVRPLAATVSVALSPEQSYDDARELFGGMFKIADRYDAAIVGGDTTRWNNPLAIDVAMTAVPFDGIDPVTRAGAKPGDTLVVTGWLGGSLLGRHLTFTPRVEEARALAETLGHRLHAMMDLSDGLSLDLWRMCQASRVGAILDEGLVEAIISDDARRAAEVDDRTPLDHALGDGEDYELLLAVSGEAVVPGVPLYRVGELTDADLLIRRSDGRTDPLEPRGYVH